MSRRPWRRIAGAGSSPPSRGKRSVAVAGRTGRAPPKRAVGPNSPPQQGGSSTDSPSFTASSTEGCLCSHRPSPERPQGSLVRCRWGLFLDSRTKRGGHEDHARPPHNRYRPRWAVAGSTPSGAVLASKAARRHRCSITSSQVWATPNLKRSLRSPSYSTHHPLLFLRRARYLRGCIHLHGEPRGQSVAAGDGGPPL